MDAAGQSEKKRPPLLRGLFFTFVLSFVNLGGLFLSVAFLGGLGEWTPWQFVGLAGLIEVGLGIAFIIAPNIWRLPVAEAQTSDRTAIRLAVDVLLIPRWASLAKVGAGIVMLVFATSREGASTGTVLVAIVAAAIATSMLAISLLAARLGVSRPHVDVLWVTVKRPFRSDIALPGLSLSGTVVQLLAGVGVIPAVKLLPPSVLYQSPLTPSRELLAGSVGTAVFLAVLALWAWRGRVTRYAPVEQLAEVEADLREPESGDGAGEMAVRRAAGR